MPPARTILFLQGPPGPFWSELADAAARRGARIVRVNLNAGDALAWRRPGALNYRGGLKRFRRWLLALVREKGVTDILYFADRLPYHRIAAAVAWRVGAQAHSVEFGYLRPDWLTLERWGGGAYSRFPSDPALFHPPGPAPEIRARYAHPFAVEALNEVAYNLAATFGRPLYPRYVSDKYYPVLFDYLCWAAKLARGGGRAARGVGAGVAGHLSGAFSFALVALQLQSDYQLRASAPYRHQADMLEEVVASFAAHAPEGMRLLVKQHPLDNGWEGWRRRVARIAGACGAGERVKVIDGGDLGRLIARASGVVTINSTVGVHALRALRPVKALGAAVYDAPGLTDPGPLDRFWAAPTAPDPETVARFVATLERETQIRGSFYDAEGRAVAAAAMAERIMAGRVGPLLDDDGGARPAATPRLRALRAARLRMRRG
ncbi:capsular biosynthesis protein [Rubrimonas cliftonensis]|uniref:Capsular polysaccharide export protein n=1 Tax=Rubrimonas cliftonensis TaxID=89524 RepID=A0A1H4FN21_9RHOB|nr:capsular biosynthesis protein [Rubrimonas cliftonensis]SEA98541.1 capsular polysaccharide export protein [Rubrimonas cliftonensis]